MLNPRTPNHILLHRYYESLPYDRDHEIVVTHLWLEEAKQGTPTEGFYRFRLQAQLFSRDYTPGESPIVRRGCMYWPYAHGLCRAHIRQHTPKAEDGIYLDKMELPGSEALRAFIREHLGTEAEPFLKTEGEGAGEED